MAGILAITPDRGDRPDFINLCEKQVESFTVRPDLHAIINYTPKSDAPDLMERVKSGWEIALHNGYDWLLIIENDDYYPSSYLESILPLMHNADIIGIEETRYYNIQNRTHQLFKHEGRSSLVTTAIRVDCFKRFTWPDCVFQPLS